MTRVTSPAPGTDAPRLQLALVEYADGPDRCTVYPPDATGLDRAATWISVDRTCVRSLNEWR
ncbi:MAG: hypothetical protein ABEJ89_01815 [Haloarculaceae archaeon]